MPGLTISSSGSQLDSLRQTFRSYAAWNGRDGAELFLDQCRKLATELYVQTSAIAPSKAEIASDVKAQGWKIPERFADGRLGRGSPAMWADHAFDKRAQKRRGRPRKGHTREDLRARRPSLAEMQAFVIARRVGARLYLASGWLGAIADLGGSLKTSSGDIDRARGGAIIRRGVGRVEVILWNRTPGIEQMNEQHQFVAKAIAYRALDMSAYIARKQREALQRMKAA